MWRCLSHILDHTWNIFYKISSFLFQLYHNFLSRKGKEMFIAISLVLTCHWNSIGAIAEMIIFIELFVSVLLFMAQTEGLALGDVCLCDTLTSILSWQWPSYTHTHTHTFIRTKSLWHLGQRRPLAGCLWIYSSSTAQTHTHTNSSLYKHALPTMSSHVQALMQTNKWVHTQVRFATDVKQGHVPLPPTQLHTHIHTHTDSLKSRWESICHPFYPLHPYENLQRLSDLPLLPQLLFPLPALTHAHTQAA